MLRAAIYQIRREFGLHSVFFVEDTSLRISALSEGLDRPGLQVKEWFASTSFFELDEQLKAKGRDRSATIKSDIALSLPGLDAPVFFHGETRGTIADTAPTFEESQQYPWLSPRNFNGWVIPDGASRRLGEMEFEESLPFDFRIRSFQMLARRLKEYQAVLRLPATSYKSDRKIEDKQYQLLPTTAPAICVVGMKCAGKTTFGDYICQTGMRTEWFEASRIFSEIRERDRSTKLRGLGPQEYLKIRGMDTVAREIIRKSTSNRDSVRIITGLRTIEELEMLYRFIGPIIVVSITADERIRYERHIKRRRDPEIETFSHFKAHDEEQKSYGLLRVLDEIADVKIDNNDSLGNYHARLNEFLTRYILGNELFVQQQSRTVAVKASELVRSLDALRSVGKYATCREIAFESKRLQAPVRLYNTNRALKAVPEFASRKKRGRELLKYRLTSSGRRLLEYLGSRYMLKSGGDTSPNSARSAARARSPAPGSRRRPRRC